MKKLISVLLIAAMAIMMVVPAMAENITGGWTIYTDTENPVPEDAAEALTKALEGMTGAAYTPVALLATQVVAGTNYAILCTITPVVPDAEPAYAIVYVYSGVDGTNEIIEVQDLTIGLSPVE